MKITQDISKIDKYVGREPLWRSWRFNHGRDHNARRFFEKIGIYKLEHIVIRHSRKIRSPAQWRKLIDERYQRRYGTLPDVRYTNAKVREIATVIERIPQDVKSALAHQYADYIRHLRKDGELYALTENGQPTEYGIWKQRKGKFSRVEIDAVGKVRKTGRLREYSSKTPIEVEKWCGKREDFFGSSKNEPDERIIGPKSTTFPMVEGWHLDGEPMRMDRVTIKTYTNALQLRRFKRPAAERAWPPRLGLSDKDVPFHKVWKIKSFFTSARDRLQWTKVWHRTLYTVGKDTSANSNKCMACDEEENILHLATCHVIKTEFWDEIVSLLVELGMKQPVDLAAFITLGLITMEEVIDKHLAGIMFLAWRCLYAEITRARIEHTNPDMQAAIRRVGTLTVTRLTAYGAHWKRWSAQRMWTSKGHLTALPLREQKVFRMESTGEYEIHNAILQLTQEKQAQ